MIEMTDQPEGFIDIHCHLLPAVDDGCQSLAETIECIAMLKEIGFVGSICTPHVGLEHYAANDVDFVKQQTEQLRGDLAANSIEYPVWSGGEMRLPKDNSDFLSSDAVPRLAGSNVVLFDWWGRDWPAQFDDYLKQLISDGLQPVLAHPERLPMDEEFFRRTMDRLTNLDVWLQANLKSFLPDMEQPIRDKAIWLLEQGRYHFIASDSHGPRSIPSRVAGLNQLRQVIDETELQRLMSDNPRQLIAVTT